MERKHIIIGAIIAIIVVSLIVFLVLRYLRPKKTEKYSDLLDFATDGANTQDQTDMMSGNEWIDTIRMEDLYGTDIEQTNADYVEKAKKKAHATTSLMYQELDHERDLVDYVGFRRYNYGAYNSPSLDGELRSAYSEQQGDISFRPTMNMTF